MRNSYYIAYPPRLIIFDIMQWVAIRLIYRVNVPLSHCRLLQCVCFLSPMIMNTYHAMGGDSTTPWWVTVCEDDTLYTTTITNHKTGEVMVVDAFSDPTSNLFYFVSG